MKKRMIGIILSAMCVLAFAACGQKDEAADAVSAQAAAVDASKLSDEYKPWADKYTMAEEKLSQCLPVEGAEMSPEEIQSKLNSVAGSINKESMSDSEKTDMDMMIANIDNLYAQSKNMCDTKLNDIIALSQGSYSGDFVQKMDAERAAYDELIAAGKYKDAYDKLLAMEEMYKENQ